jgi:hypothetical protein
VQKRNPEEIVKSGHPEITITRRIQRLEEHSPPPARPKKLRRVAAGAGLFAIANPDEPYYF